MLGFVEPTGGNLIGEFLMDSQRFEIVLLIEGDMGNCDPEPGHQVRVSLGQVLRPEESDNGGMTLGISLDEGFEVVNLDSCP
ncbi:MAG: hypothetical protein M3Z66_15390 [Chloroflexota bacterium]|nr:hypothetical protein [Chloroflexota bacterium]